MRYLVMALAVTGVVYCGALNVAAQTTSDPPATASPPAPPAVAPAPTTPPTPAPPPGPKARDYQGLDVFGSDSQQIGKVVKASETPDGKVSDIEIHSSGFFGYFAKVYVVPAAKTTVKSGRVELAATSDEAKQWLK